MRSSFFGFNVATQGLFSARAGLDVTNHNIANSDTKGYSRQSIVQQAGRPLRSNNGGMIGTGSTVVDIIRHRERYLDVKYWNSSCNLGHYSVKRQRMAELETYFKEPSDDGFNKVMNGFFDSIQNLIKKPTDKGIVISEATKFVDYFNSISTQFQDMQTTLNYEVGTKVNRINDISDQIARLNKQIYSLEVKNNISNDLKDQREKLVDELSKLVNVEVTEYKDSFGYNCFKVDINNQTLVNHFDNNKLKLVSRQNRLNPEDAVGLYDIEWELGQPFDMHDPSLSGELKACIDIRDGNNGAKFDGNISSITTVKKDTIDLKDVAYKLPESGTVEVDGTTYSYTDIVYDKKNKVAKLIGVSPAMTTLPPIKEVKVGGSIVGEVSSCAKEDIATVKIDNPSRVDIIGKGKAIIGNTICHYDGVEVGADGSVTLKGVVPAPTTVGAKVTIGEDVKFKGIPYYQNKLNQFVRTFAKKFNEIHKKGKLPDGTLAGDFFVTKGESSITDYNKLTAQNFSVSQILLDDSDKLATSINPTTGESDNRLIHEFAELKQEKIFSNGDLANYMEMLVAEVGIDSEKCKSLAKNQVNIGTTIENQRISVSGVEKNEETQNMMKYLHAYNLASKMISVMNEIYDVTINRMGV